MATKEPKLYYVTGKDWYGNASSVKTYAQTPAEARDNALWKLKTTSRVYRADKMK